MADVWLDCVRTMTKFEAVLSGLTSSPDTIPTAIILQGPFLAPFSADRHGRRPPAHIRLQTALERLADALLRHPALVQRCKLFLQPSPSDPLVPRVEPRLAWPEPLLAPLSRAGISAQMLSHPGRLFFFGRELVILGTDLSQSLARAQLIPAAQPARVSVFRTLLEQAHCCPLPLGMQARTWTLDHALTLYPIPNYVRSDWFCQHLPVIPVADPLGTKRAQDRNRTGLCGPESGLFCHGRVFLPPTLSAPRASRTMVSGMVSETTSH